MLVLVASHSVAQDGGDDPGAIFDHAVELHTKGEYAEAAREFSRAYEIAPTGDAAYNAAVAWEASGNEARAADSYALALAHELAPEAAKDASERLAALAGRLGILEITAPAGSKIHLGDRSRSGPSVRFHAAAGGRVVVATLPDGRREARSVRVIAGKTARIVFAADEKARPARAADATAESHRREESRWETLGWIGVGGGAALALTATFLGLQTLAARDDYDASGHTNRGAREEAASLRTWTNVAWTSAAVVGGTGVVLLLTRPGEPAATSVLVTPSGAALSKRF